MGGFSPGALLLGLSLYPLYNKPKAERQNIHRSGCVASLLVSGILVNSDVDGLISLEDEGGILEGWGPHLTPSVVAEAILL